MTYKDRLESLTNDNHIYQGGERTQEIANDLKKSFSDGSIFGELIAESVSASINKILEQSGLDDLIVGGIDGIKSVVSEGANKAFRSEDFTNNLSLKMSQKEVDREQNSYANKQQELGA